MMTILVVQVKYLLSLTLFDSHLMSNSNIQGTKPGLNSELGVRRKPADGVLIYFLDPSD